MALIQGVTVANVAEVDAGTKALRVSMRALDALAWNSVGARSGALTTAAASGALFSFRNGSANPVLVRRVGCGFITTTAFTAAQEMAFALTVARSFTVADSGGTAIALTGSNTKHRASLGVLTAVDCRICTTAALTAGTKTLDTNPLAVIGGYAGGVGQGVTPAANNLFNHDPEDYPLVLAQNEGINIQNVILMGAAGVGTFYANIEVAELTSY